MVSGLAVAFVVAGVLVCLVGLLRTEPSTRLPGHSDAWARPPVRVRNLPPNLLGAQAKDDGWDVLRSRSPSGPPG